jgi:hypothetical protein
MRGTLWYSFASVFKHLGTFDTCAPRVAIYQPFVDLRGMSTNSWPTALNSSTEPYLTHLASL